MEQAIKESIASYSKRLSETGSDELGKRVKKRILQKLGKLKKELALATSDTNSSQVSNKRKLDEIAESTCEETTNNDAPLSKQERKVKLRILNQDLAEFAQKKLLKQAKKRFELGLRKGIKVDVHTYTNLMNVYVRCNDMTGAEEVLQKMLNGGITPNLITYTTLLKGYCEIGNMARAQRIYFHDIKEKLSLHPNVRTLNTFLRGCARTGLSNPAVAAFLEFCSGIKKSTDNKSSTIDAASQDQQQPDASTYEYLVGLLCRSGKLQQAEQIVARFINNPSSNHSSSSSVTKASSTSDTTIIKSAGGVEDVMENTAIYLAFATLTALRGEYSNARQWLQLAADAMKISESAALKDSMQKKFKVAQQTMSHDNGNKIGSSSGNSSSSSTRSVALFLRHRSIELNNHMEILQDYVHANHSNNNNTTTTVSSTAAAVSHLELQCRFIASMKYLSYCSQVLYFGFDGLGDDENAITTTTPISSTAVNDLQECNSNSNSYSSTIIIEKLVVALIEKFGLNSFCKLNNNSDDNKTEDPNNSNNSALSTASTYDKILKESLSDVVSRVRQCIIKETTIATALDGYIDFHALFGYRHNNNNNSQYYCNDTITTSSSNTTYGNAAGRGDNSDDDNMEEEEVDITSSSNSSTKEDRLPPIKLEICSGDGEWVVAQAAADWTTTITNSQNTTTTTMTRVPKAVWVALELRCDRVQRILAHHILQTSSPHNNNNNNCSSSKTRSTSYNSNLAILGGDATIIVPDRIPPGSIAAIFINHPQPPERVNGTGSNGSNHATTQDITTNNSNQGTHLLTALFFRQLHTILQPDGTITIVTDNLLYAKALAATIADLVTTSSSDTTSASVALFMSAANTITTDDTAVVSTINEGKKNAATDASSSKTNNQQQQSVDAGGGLLLPSHWDHILDDSYPIRTRGASSTTSTSCGVIEVWRGEPGIEAGHVVPASSYFDRMWDLGQKKRRWFLYIRKMKI